MSILSQTYREYIECLLTEELDDVTTDINTIRDRIDRIVELENLLAYITGNDDFCIQAQKYVQKRVAKETHYASGEPIQRKDVL